MKLSIATSLLFNLMAFLPSQASDAALQMSSRASNTVVQASSKKAGATRRMKKGGKSCPPCPSEDCPPPSVCPVCSTQESSLNSLQGGDQYKSVTITKDYILDDEAYVNAQFLTIDEDDDGDPDGIEGFASFQFLNEDGTEGQAVTVQSAYANREINIIAEGVYLRIDYNSEEDIIFTLYNKRNPEGKVLSPGVSANMISGTLNDTGLGNPSQFQLYKAIDLFVRYIFGVVFPPPETRRALVEFDRAMGIERGLESCDNAGWWKRFWYGVKITAACVLSSIALAWACSGTGIGFLACAGVSAANVSAGCAATIADGC